MIEYYKCVDNTGTCSFTKGKIYKIRNPHNLEDYNNFIDDSGATNGWKGQNYKHFSPSTYEEFILQETGEYLIQDSTYLIPILEKLNKN